MMNQSPLAMAMRSLSAEGSQSKTVLDSATGAGAPQGAAAYATADLRLKAAAVIQQWAETSPDDLADGESMADRLMSMVVGVADADKDGEITDDEQAVCDTVLENMWDYLLSKGVSDDDCDALLNNWGAAAADRAYDLIVTALPEGEEASAEDMDSFAFDADSDSAVFDAVYKKKVVVRGGRKVRINKRVSGHVRLSAKQKISIRKMLRKSHSATATMHRIKSNRIRKAAGL
jgi:hypothetical protein